MKSPKVTLTVEGTPYVPVRLVELKRLRAVEKAAREVVTRAALRRYAAIHRPSLRKLALAVRR